MVKPGIVTPNEPMRISGDHLSRFTFLYVLVVLALWPLVPMLELPCLAIRENTNIQREYSVLHNERWPASVRQREADAQNPAAHGSGSEHFQTQSMKYAGLSIARQAAGGSTYLNVGGALTTKSLFLWYLFTR